MATTAPSLLLPFEDGDMLPMMASGLDFGSGDLDQLLSPLFAEVVDAPGSTLDLTLAPPPPPTAYLKQEGDAPAVCGGLPAHSTPLDSCMMTEDGSSAEQEETSGGATQQQGSNGPQQKGRRRRVRNAKQQELNRLAQQRYRQRKKQKALDLSHQVDNLSCQLEQLRAKDAELCELKRVQADLTQQVLAQQAVLQQAHERLLSQERTITEQAAQISKLQIQREQQQDVLGSPSTTPGDLGTHNGNLVLSASDAAHFSDQLAGVLREALTELGVQVPVPGAHLDSLLRRHLASKIAARAAAAACATTVPAPVGEPRPRTPITVSCC